MKLGYTLFFLLLSYAVLFSQQNKVLIIGIDGVRTDALRTAATPNLDGLLQQAIYSYDALNDDITISGPGWSAILCGVWSPKHEVLNNDFSNNNYDTYPSIFQLAESYSSDLHTVSFCHWGPINDFIIDDDVDFKLNLSSDTEVAQQAVNYLSVNDPDLMFLHFDDVDHTGHGSGFSPKNPAYLSAIEGVDDLVGQVLESLQNRPDYEQENWLILVTTDHGGQGNSHGGNSFHEENVFVIASASSLEATNITRDSSWVPNTTIDCLEHEDVLTFNGDGSSVNVPSTDLLEFGTEQDFTIECRVRTAVSGDVTIVGNKDWNSGVNPGFIFSFRYPNGPEWKVNIGDGSNRADINIGGSIADEEWHTLSVTFDRDGLMKMYEDGVFIAETDISFIGDINTDTGLLFGADVNSGYPYTGELAEVRTWNKVLSPIEIAAWHCQTLNESHTSYDNLIGYWPLASAEDMIIDQTENNLNGINNGAVWQSVDSLLLIDYSNTPRLVDVALTALQHLCIPIDENWNLDGQSLVPVCDITGIATTINHQITITPNPLQDGVLTITGAPELTLVSLSIYNTKGNLIRELQLSSATHTFDLSELTAGTYILVLKDNNGKSNVSKLIVPQ